MGLRGLVRDVIYTYFGLRILLGLVWPLNPDELIFFGLTILGFSLWFMAERLKG
jgi:hypothetical protein